MSGTATIAIKFGDGSTTASSINGHLSAEVDSRTSGLNGGKTSFAPGETVWVLVYKSSNVGIKSVVASAGSITQGANVTVSKSFDTLFEDTKQASLPVPADSITSNVWMGRSLGNMTLNTNKQGVTVDVSGVAVNKTTISCTALTYGVTAPANINGETSFSILVLITGEEIVV